MSHSLSVPSSSKKRYDLVETFNAMALAGSADLHPQPKVVYQPKLRDSHAKKFVGGFNPNYIPTAANIKPPGPTLHPNGPHILLPAHSQDDRRAQHLGLNSSSNQRDTPRPPKLHPGNHSLTMQYAWAPSEAKSRSDTALTSLHATVSPSSDVSPDTRAQLPLPTLPSARSKRQRSVSSPPFSASSSNGNDTVQCSGITQSGKRCTRLVKVGPPLAQMYPELDVERFCFQHAKALAGPSGFRSHKTADWIKFEDWIPDYLHSSTQTNLRVEMEKPRSQSDEAGYIYTFELLDHKDPNAIQLKVGRAVNLIRRLDQWAKQCGSHEQILRGFWPESVEDETSVSGSLMKGRIRAGPKGVCCHRVERLVHLELADLALHAPYLEPSFPQGKAIASNNPGVAGRNDRHVASNPSVRAGGSPSGKIAALKPCPDCGATHKEIFTFKRVQGGKYTGKEWDLIVKPVIEKWGAFVEHYV